jgi:hypothetical protein
MAKAKKTMNIYIRQALLIFNWTLVGLSIISLIFVFLEVFHRPFDCSLIGIETFFKILATFSTLYAATFVVLTTIFTIDRLGIMQESNDNTWLSNSRAIWFQIMKEVIGEIKREDNYMYRDILTKSIRIHDYLFALNYGFENKQQLEIFYKTFTQGQVAHYENMNQIFIGVGIYRDTNHSYTFQNYRYAIVNIVNPDICYLNWLLDLEEFYMTDVRLFNANQINLALYRSAIANGQHKIP